MLTKIGNTLTYDVSTPVTISAGTFVRLEISGMKNPSTTGAFNASITTKDISGTTIDGPSSTNVYNIKQISTTEIADNAITTTKIAPASVNTDDITTGAVTSSKIADGAITTPNIASSFAFQRFLSDGENGWEPNGINTIFVVTDPLIEIFDVVIINISTPNAGGPICGLTATFDGSMEIKCTSPPSDFTDLNYIVMNPPIL